MNEIVAACEKHWNKNSANCSGFVRAVANEFSVILAGQANNMVDAMQRHPWQKLDSGVQAGKKAVDGNLVIGGIKGPVNGHVVIVVPGLLAHNKYPTAYWGTLRGAGKKNTTLNYAFTKNIRDTVIYACISIK